MVDNTSKLKENWAERQKKLGNTPRSVLYKNFPDFLNTHIHNKHINFILKQLPKKPKKILDVGCGYGRISSAIKKHHPSCDIHGVELCEEFAENFTRTIGPCFTGSIQQYQPENQYDAILFITSLMYLPKDEILSCLEKYWGALKSEGVMIIIEPYNGILIRTRKSTGNTALKPTGGELVTYFEKGEIKQYLYSLLNHQELYHQGIGIIPIIQAPRLHDAYSIKRGKI